jgi:hypothetical protein
VAEGEERQFAGGAQRIVMHAGTPDMPARLASQGVIDGAGEDVGTERQQQLEDAMAQVIEIPAGLAEEAVKRAVMFETAQLGGLNDAGEGAAAGAKNPGAGEGPEGAETGLGKAGLKGEQKGRKGTEQEIGHQGSSSFIL